MMTAAYAKAVVALVGPDPRVSEAKSPLSDAAPAHGPLIFVLTNIRN
jgi:hypothetical protein